MNNLKGFSLLELMIVVAIIGILGAIVYPSYQDSVREAKRSEAIAELQKLIAAQERYFLNNREYANNLTLLGLTESWTTDHYSIKAGECTDIGINLCVELTATGTGGQADDGKIIMSTIGRSVHVDKDGNETQL
jgi:type IV pilus assembly protein PilE